ncbi:hypothetical protein ACIRU3_21390 [Streptomyces sp. NPDC101151]
MLGEQVLGQAARQDQCVGAGVPGCVEWTNSCRPGALVTVNAS